MLRSLTELTFSFLHGVAHLFGAPHDDQDAKTYSKTRKTYRYLMNPYMDSFGEGRTILSSSSIDSISGLIHKRGNWCLKQDSGPICGNTITEEGEECDCGTNATCNAIDPNCTPSDDTGEDRPCTIRRSKNRLCSARESVCCTENGLYVSKKENKLCTSNYNECVLPEFCNGLSEECPHFDLPRHRSLCAGNSRLCHHGICNGSICWRYNLLECECQEERFACHVCCFHNEVCDALYFHAKSFEVPMYIKKFGEYCMQDTGYCNQDGICIKFTYNLFEASSQHFLTTYFIILAILIVFCMLLKISFYVTEVTMRRAIRNFLSMELGKTEDSELRLNMLFPTVPSYIIQMMMMKLGNEDLAVTSLIASGIPMRIEFNKPIFIPTVKNYHLIDSAGDSPCDNIEYKRLNKALSLLLIEEIPF
ncbi:disintegrin and metalloproteinase domain-containing protein 10-like [Centruroides vittatus]|uniref:disintegrin and metalloproteinase domain-containing protein 10-like n=1 Tax=Centruroides vittatus TaxID=120091 RepID=UPI003510B454